jgi:hypothetical protein
VIDFIIMGDNSRVIYGVITALPPQEQPSPPQDRAADHLSLFHTAVPCGYNSGTNMLKQYVDFGRY